MRHYIFFTLAFVLAAFTSVHAQQYEQLKTLKDHAARTYCSAGHEQRATSIALRVDNAMSVYQQMLPFKPDITLLVLSTDDWPKYATMPVIYGMPHYNDRTKALIVAAEDNAFWKSFLPPLEQLPEDFRGQVQTVYKNGDNLSMQPFFDLPVLHELGHAFHNQDNITMQRKWMGELFVNILLHTYIAENEPQLLPALTLFPRMVISGGTKEFKYTSLQDIEAHYNEVAQKFPKNYGWYQCRWHYAAGVIYDKGGKQVSRKLWDTLKNKTAILPDEQLIHFLAKADQSVADVITYWESNTVK